jgi:voltage-gated potassium channel Kch
MKSHIKKTIEKIEEFSEENDWDIGLIVLALVAFVFDTIGFMILFEQNNMSGQLHDFVYLSIRLFGFDLQTPNIDTSIPWVLDVGRWLSALTTIWALLLAVKHIFKDKWNLYKRGQGHIVIIGAGSKGKTLALDWIMTMREESNSIHGKLIVCIEKDKSNSNVDVLKEEGVVVIFGDATDKQTLIKAKIELADSVVCVTDSDSTNMEIVSTISDMIDNKENKEKNVHNKMNCYVHLLNNEFYDFFNATRFNEKISQIKIKIFNINSNSARMLFNEKPLGFNKLTDEKIIKNPDTKLKVAIFGFGKLGESILVHSLHLGHFYNENPIDVTLVYDQDCDENANLIDEFTKQYNIGIDKEKQENTQFEEYWKVRFIDDGDFDKEDITQYSQIVVAYEDEFTSLSNLMKLLKKYNDEILSHKIDIAIYSNSFASTAEVIKTDKPNTPDQNTVFKQVRTFGEVDKTCSYDMVVGQILDEQAALNNKQYNELHGYDDKSKSTQQEWDALSMFLQDSNRYLVEHNKIKKFMIDKLVAESKITNKYEEIKESIKKQLFNYPNMTINWDDMGLKNHNYAIRLAEEEMIQLAKVEHNRWNAFHILNGWKKLDIPDGTRNKIVKDKIRKLHPCLVSWDELDIVSENHQHNYKSDDLETIMRIPSLDKLMDKK